MKNPATTIVIFNCQLQRPGRLALVKGEGTVRDNLRRVEGHEPLTSILSLLKWERRRSIKSMTTGRRGRRYKAAKPQYCLPAR